MSDIKHPVRAAASLLQMSAAELQEILDRAKPTPVSSNAHVKEFTDEYPLPWITVKLQVVPHDEKERRRICEALSQHMDKPLPRWLLLSEVGQ